jgi:ribonuclease BN (tRNA processing enzyme)
MKLTIVGSGTAVPDGSRNSAGFFVELPEATLMMDCGAGTVHALARYGLPWQQLSHLFISHFHVDHVGELASLFFGLKWGREVRRDHSITIIGPRGTDRLMAGLDQTLGPGLFEPGFPVNAVIVEPGETVRIGTEAVLSVAKTPHTTESLAARIESRGRTICYTGDTGYSDPLADFFNGADILISECSFPEPRDGVPHLSVDDVARLAERAGVGRLVVTHFYFRFEEAKLKERLSRGYSGEISIAADGLRFEL